MAQGSTERRRMAIRRQSVLKDARIHKKRKLTDAPKYMRRVRCVIGNIQDTHDPAMLRTGPNLSKTGKRHRVLHDKYILRSKEEQVEIYRLGQHAIRDESIEVGMPQKENY